MQAAYCLEQLPSWDGRHDFYYWYYATIGIFQVGGTAWEKWNDALTATLVDNQRKYACARGSWDTAGSAYGRRAGRVWTTAVGCLCLEVYYRYKREIKLK